MGEAADGAVAVSQTRALAPDVVLMDIRMPHVDGIAATRTITEETSARVLVLTSFEIDEYVFESLRAGAAGYLLKTASADAMLDAIRAVHSGESVLSPQITRTVIDAFVSKSTRREDVPDGPDIDALTAREQEVFTCLGEGLSNRQIATRLGIGENTAKTHVARVLHKLGLQSRIQAAILARDMPDHQL
ncbi:two component LuxR family transcriptional regulator [Rhodococcus pyridinivorans AK37]|uniref:Two component LuxR family transcriptional regulator n=1 Tax=Rhodococcus pyridinivorans AK37 TaxID=1114960 RepID=H0JVU5_9NOCA|nr:two component LuxR family transcriptional regulator [Rhodococcus pyridinivorans AK37]